MPEDGVTVAPQLCRVVARLAVLGLAEITCRDGGPPSVPGLASLLTALDSSSGTAPVTVMPDIWITTSQAAAVLGLSCRQARKLAAAGRLIARRHGRDWQVSRQSAQDYARGRTG